MHLKPLDIKSALASFGIGLGAMAMAYIFPVGLMLMPALLAFAGTVWGYGALAIAAITAAGGIICLAGTVDAGIIGLLVMSIPAGAASAYIFKNRLPYRSAAVIGAFFAALGIYIITCVPALLNGEGPFGHYLQVAAAFGRAAKKAAAEMGVDGERLELLRKMTAQIEYRAPDMAMVAMMGMGMGAGLVNTVAARALCSAAGAGVKPMARFYAWQLSRGFTRGSIVMVIGAIIISSLKINNYSAIVAAVECAVAGPYSLMGVCLMAFMVKMKLRGRVFTVVSVTALVLLFPYSVYGLCIMGAVDRLFRLRRSYMERMQK